MIDEVAVKSAGEEEVSSTPGPAAAIDEEILQEVVEVDIVPDEKLITLLLVDISTGLRLITCRLADGFVQLVRELPGSLA